MGGQASEGLRVIFRGATERPSQKSEPADLMLIDGVKKHYGYSVPSTVSEMIPGDFGVRRGMKDPKLQSHPTCDLPACALFWNRLGTS